MSVPTAAQHTVLESSPESCASLSATSATSTMPLDSVQEPRLHRCTYILPKKKRRCRMSVKHGEFLCVAHSGALPECPECHTHLSSNAALEKHLRKQLCPALRQRNRVETQPYFIADINTANFESPCGFSTSIAPVVHESSSNIDHSQLTKLIDRVLPQLQIPSLTETPPLPEAPAIYATWSDPRDSTVKLEHKHFPQIAALAARLLNPPPTKVTIVDLAAGRAYTSLYVAHVLGIRSIPGSFIAIDRASSRLKADRSLRHLHTRHPSIEKFQRITIDLRHLSLSGLAECTEAADVRIIGKHICGFGLDLALTAATRFAVETNRTTHSVRLVLACCCRKLCHRSLFSNQGSVWDYLNVDDSEFMSIKTAANWGLDVAHSTEMALIGKKCRQLIDAARVNWLNAVGWDARLETYTTASPENACIVATWIGTSLPPKIGDFGAHQPRKT